MATWEAGALVWARIAGLPYWPGQVMDPDSKLAQNPKIQRRRTNKPGIVLVSFFGDSTYNWLDRGCLESFEKFYDRRKTQPVRQKHLQETYIIAVEEAKELWDRREGREPLTDHEPIDFLSPETWPYIDGPLPPPPPPTTEDLELTNAEHTLAWLRSMASNPLSCPKNPQPNELAAQRLVCGAYWRPKPKEPPARQTQHEAKQHANSEKKPSRSRSQAKREGAHHSSKKAEPPAEDAAADQPASEKPTRKRKVAAEVEETAAIVGGEEAASVAGGEETAAVDGTEEAPPPTKKRRGRPPKNREPVVEQDAGPAETQDVPKDSTAVTPKERRERKKQVKEEPSANKAEQKTPAPMSKTTPAPAPAVRLEQKGAGSSGKRVSQDGEQAVSSKPVVQSGPEALEPEQQQPAGAPTLLHPLTVEMQEIVKTIKAAARHPRRHMKQRRAATTTLEAEAAILLFRETACSESLWNREQMFGRPTERALIRCGALPRPPPVPEPEPEPVHVAEEKDEHEVVEPSKKPEVSKAKKVKADAKEAGAFEGQEGGEGEGSSSGEDDDQEAPGRGRAVVRPPSRIELVELQVKDYVYRVGSREQFDTNLQRYYGEKDQQMGMPVLHGEELDMYTIFKEVAARGGFDAVEKTYGGWRQVALVWRPELAEKHNIRQNLSRAYRKYLLAFEQSLSAHASFKTITIRPLITRFQGQLDLKTSTTSPSVFHKRKLPVEEGQQQGEEEDASLKKARTADGDSASRKGTIQGDTGRARMREHLADNAASHSRVAYAPAPGGRDGLQRVMLKFPAGIGLPSKSQIQAWTKDFGEVTPENILTDRNKAAVSITFNTPQEAAQAEEQLGRVVHGALSLPENSVKVSRVRGSLNKPMTKRAEPAAAAEGPNRPDDDSRPADSRNRPTVHNNNDKDPRGNYHPRQEDRWHDNERGPNYDDGRGFNRGQNDRNNGPSYERGDHGGLRWGPDTSRGRYEPRGPWRQEDSGRRPSAGRQYDGGPQHMNGGRASLENGMPPPPTATALHVGGPSGPPQDPRRPPQARNTPAPMAGPSPGAVYITAPVGGAPTLLVAQQPQAARPTFIPPNVIITSLTGHPHQLSGPGAHGPPRPVLLTYSQPPQAILQQAPAGHMGQPQHQFQAPQQYQQPPQHLVQQPPHGFAVVQHAQHAQQPLQGAPAPSFHPMPPQQAPPSIPIHQGQVQAPPVTQPQYASAQPSNPPNEQVFDKAAIQRLLEQVSGTRSTQAQAPTPSPAPPAINLPPINTGNWSPSRNAETYSPRKSISDGARETNNGGEYSPTAGRRNSSPTSQPAQDGASTHLNQLLAILGGMNLPKPPS